MTYAEEPRTESIPVTLADGTVIKVEVSQTGREDVVDAAHPFSDVTNALGGIVAAIAEPIHRAKPSKATVKFGMEVVVESGKLTALLVKGSGKANLEITLEWTKEVVGAKPSV